MQFPAHGPEPAAHRKLLHTREIVCEGYLRDDGRIDIEGRLRDLTAAQAQLAFHAVEAGGAIHDMRLVMTIDMDMHIHQLRALTAAGPTPFCAEINAAYDALQGLRIGAGFKRQVRERVGGAAGCTHLTEMVSTMAGTAVQVVLAMRREQHGSTRGFSDDRGKGHWIVDTCHAYRSDGQAIRFLMGNGRVASRAGP